MTAPARYSFRDRCSCGSTYVAGVKPDAALYGSWLRSHEDCRATFRPAESGLSGHEPRGGFQGHQGAPENPPASLQRADTANACSNCPALGDTMDGNTRHEGGK